ncbi:4-alpha-glucanotransferase [Thermus filiformis]|uniref:4-alpha-glucanotransferase n=1 Tax=Thermus filiformis TaxID=276 RepID=A0A0A2X7D9_THEFI|nr:4-alpha-glucanotransferase [Thermus filiformis]KGQ21124.1 4-alpha-glucanotransferase [Thermus filiformis]
MDLPRAYGILLHPTSLPGPEPVGTLGEAARRFLRLLAEAGGRYWQVLPLGPTGYGDSPYQALSAFAGNPYLIDLQALGEEDFPPSGPRVDYGLLYRWKWGALRRAFARIGLSEEAYRFFAQEGDWLWDYALFMALKDRFQKPWNEWPAPLKRREASALEAARKELEEEVLFHAWTQWVFFSQWEALKREAEGLGLFLIGDMPLYVALDSAEVWAAQEAFHLDEEGRPTVVAGVPPDYFSETGQRWGNPIYRWDRMEEEGFSWWLKRFGQALRLFHLVRLDHFRGLCAYWEIPASCPTAVEGRWVRAPGEALLAQLQEAFGQVPVLAEDLGVITEDVVALRERFGLPGMKVLQFAFDDGMENPFLPHNYPEDGRVVVYTGTHDNDTTLGWYRTATPHERAFLERYLRDWGIVFREEREVPWALIALAMKSRARLAVFPVQDVLALGSEARMNYPGRAEGNWAFRLPGLDLEEPFGRLRALAQAEGR